MILFNSSCHLESALSLSYVRLISNLLSLKTKFLWRSSQLYLLDREMYGILSSKILCHYSFNRSC